MNTIPSDGYSAYNLHFHIQHEQHQNITYLAWHGLHCQIQVSTGNWLWNSLIFPWYIIKYSKKSNKSLNIHQQYVPYWRYYLIDVQQYVNISRQVDIHEILFICGLSIFWNINALIYPHIFRNFQIPCFFTDIWKQYSNSLIFPCRDFL